MVKLSDRMRAVAACVTPGLAVADIGCDHGYLPIYLVEHHIAPEAVAMDIKEGPLQAAREHIHSEGLDDKIKTRRSDGLEALLPGEVQSVIIAGMGGRLALKILKDSSGFMECTRDIREVIVQPQSELALFRRGMREMGYFCVQEDMVFEDGKFYPMGRYLPAYIGKESGGEQEKLSIPGCYPAGDDRSRQQVQRLLKEQWELADDYGPWLLSNRHPVLFRFLEREREQLYKIRESVYGMQDEEARQNRLREVEDKLAKNEKARSIFM